MKTETLFYYIFAFFVFFTIVGLLIGAVENKPDLSKKGKLIWKISWSIAILLFFLFQMNGLNRNYDLSKEQEFWDKYRIPQIDSTMIYYNANRNRETYLSCSKDSILHLWKTISYDLFEIYSVTDIFINRKDSLILTSTFIKPNLIRDSSRIFSLDNYKGSKNNTSKSVNKEDFDSIITVWGLRDNLYKRFIVP